MRKRVVIHFYKVCVYECTIIKRENVYIDRIQLDFWRPVLFFPNPSQRKLRIIILLLLYFQKYNDKSYWNSKSDASRGHHFVIHRFKKWMTFPIGL